MRYLLASLLIYGGLVETLHAEPADLLQDHPLAGSLWQNGEQVETDALFHVVEGETYILLGEKHDNAEHHRLQAWVLAELVRRGRRPAVVWEMADASHDEAFREAKAEDMPALGEALAWEERGWPAWSEYAPIAEVALEAKLPMTGGAPPPDLLKSLMKGGSLTPEEAERIGWARGYDEAQREVLYRQLEESHCGHLPESALPAVAEAQRLRDAWMAASLREAAAREGSEGALLVTGAQHAREDRGVPWQLGGSALTVAFEEVERDKVKPDDYPILTSGLFDFVWFTPRVDEEDPCERFGGRKPNEG